MFQKVEGVGEGYKEAYYLKVFSTGVGMLATFKACVILTLVRSPSPEPIYNNEGKRLNTREYRTRKKLEEDRHKLIQEALALNTDYKPPADYK